MEGIPYFFKTDCKCTSTTGATVDIPSGIYNVTELGNVAIHVGQGRVIDIPAAEFARLQAEGIVSIYRVIP